MINPGNSWKIIPTISDFGISIVIFGLKVCYLALCFAILLMLLRRDGVGVAVVNGCGVLAAGCAIRNVKGVRMSSSPYAKRAA